MRKCFPLLCALFLVAGFGLGGNLTVSAQTNVPKKENDDKKEKKEDINGKKEKREKVDSIPLVGEIYDRLTTRHVLNTKVEVLRPDSSVISVAEGGYFYYNYSKNHDSVKRDSTSRYTVNVPRVAGNYLIKVTKDGYEPHYLSYPLVLGKRDVEKEVPKIYLSRQKVTTLEDFTVKASKVMFYNKGDTIVYNADAFMLPEGSMLDALIVQMPGVEIRDGGKIYVNGRFVETLLLNGKDFFKGDQNVMLENIGAYAVKDVAVYEKKDEMDAILGNREDVDKDYVMDVRLKKDYMTGFMVNAEAGGGTKSRYLGRLFAMTYTNNARGAVYGNANNVNVKNRLAENEFDMGDTDGDGITRKVNGGIDYLADNALHTWEASGNVDASYRNRQNTVVTNAVRFLQTADNYDFSHRNMRARDFSLSTSHNFKLKKDSWNMTLKPQFTYNKKRDNDETVAATFSEEFQGMNQDIVKSIYTLGNNEMRKALINRNLKNLESNGHGYDAQFNGETRVKIPGSPDAMVFKLQSKYSRSSLFGDNLQDICFGDVPATSQLLHQFTSERPKYSFNIQALARYYFRVPIGNLNMSYEFAHTQTRKNSDISMLEAMAENSMAEFIPGALPVPDFANSYTSKLYKNEHRIKLKWGYKKKYERGKLELTLQPQFYIESQHLFYHRGETFAAPHRSYLRFKLEDCKIAWTAKTWNIRAGYNIDQKAVNLVNLVDIRNTTDPLNIWVGNPDLKNSTTHSVWISFNHSPNKRLTHYAYIFSDITVNDIVNGYRYDSQTGVRTMKTYNISGNNITQFYYNIFYRFGPSDTFHVSNFIGGTLANYSNMVGYDAEPTPQRVRNYSLDDNFSIGWRTEKYTLSLHGGVQANKAHSNGVLPTRLNNGIWSGGLYGHAELPFNFNINTDFYVVKRFGYIDDSMNTIDCLWNASLGYEINKGVWRITLDAKDILNRNKGLNYVVDATGRTQTLNTVLPRYLMLTIHYRFDFKPKRKK